MARQNRRAMTDRVVRDNRIYDIRLMSEGYFMGRSDAAYYRRRIRGNVFTGPTAEGIRLARKA